MQNLPLLILKTKMLWHACIPSLQQHNNYRDKVFNASQRLRAMSLGQDRYRRSYWVLPQCGGIFVEGVESAEPDFYTGCEDQEATKAKNELEEKGEEKSEEKPEEMHVEDALKAVDTREEVTMGRTDSKALASAVVNGDAVKGEKEEPTEVDRVEKPEEKAQANGTVTENNALPDLVKSEKDEVVAVKQESSERTAVKEESSLVKEEEKLEQVPLVNGTLDSIGLLTAEGGKLSAFKQPDLNALQSPENSKFASLFHIPEELKPDTKLATPKDDGLVHKSISGTIFNNHVKSPLSPNRSAFCSIDSILGSSSDSKLNNTSLFGKHFVSTSMLLSSPLTSSGIYSSFNTATKTTTLTDSWFSILPKTPCDEKNCFPSRAPSASPVPWRMCRPPVTVPMLRALHLLPSVLASSAPHQPCHGTPVWVTWQGAQRHSSRRRLHPVVPC